MCEYIPKRLYKCCTDCHKLLTCILVFHLFCKQSAHHLPAERVQQFLEDYLLSLKLYHMALACPDQMCDKKGDNVGRVK